MPFKISYKFLGRRTLTQESFNSYKEAKQSKLYDGLEQIGSKPKIVVDDSTKGEK